MRIIPAVLALLACSLPALALAQDQSTEDKLREALRQSIVQLRQLQDSQAQLQADRDSAMRQRDALQQEVTQLQARIAAQPPKPPPDQLAALRDQVSQLMAALDAAKRDNGALASSNQKWQAAYRQAAGIAQAKDAEARQLGQDVQKLQKAHDADYDANKKLAALAGDILHLYRTVGFRRLLLGSYEPLLGFDEVKLENLVQDYEDKIYDLRIFPPKPLPTP
jgi:chromosome segregation ATPase